MSLQPVKHGHQHRALGPDPIPGISQRVVARAILNQHYVTVGNNNDEVKIDFDVVQTSDSSIFSWNVAKDTVTVHPKGAYLVTAQIQWRDVGGNGTPNGPSGILLYGAEGAIEDWGEIEDPFVQTNQKQAVTSTFLLPAIDDFTDTASAGITVYATQHAADGLTHDVQEARLTIVRLGDQPLLHDPSA